MVVNTDNEHYLKTKPLCLINNLEMFENCVYGITVTNQNDVFEESKRRLNFKIFIIHYVRVSTCICV
jgi:hypothetical protein